MIIDICKPLTYQISFQFLVVYTGMQFQQNLASVVLIVHQTVPIKSNSNILIKKQSSFDSSNNYYLHSAH